MSTTQTNDEREGILIETATAKLMMRASRTAAGSPTTRPTS